MSYAMKYAHMFRYNIPADNHLNGHTNGFINVLAEWNGDQFFDDGRPMVNVSPINLTFYECIIIKSWYVAKNQIEKIAQKHFSDIAKAERINKARATLIAEGEPTGCPTLDLYEIDLITQQTLS